MSKTKIFWTAEERELVYIRLRAIFREIPGTSSISAIRQAQTVLPAERRRPVGDQLAWRLKELIEQARMEQTTENKLSWVDKTFSEDALLNSLADRVAQRVLEGLKNAKTD